MKLKIILFITLLFLSGCSSGQKNEIKNEETNKVVETEESKTNDELPKEDSPVTDKEIEESNKPNENAQEDVIIPSKSEKAEEKKTESNNNTQVNSAETQTKQEKEKHTCDNNDKGYVNWLSNLSKTYDTLRFYNSFESAYNDGDLIARKYLYGFFVSPAPYEYSDDICEAKVYSIRLYVPKKLCEDNEAIYLPNSVSFENDDGISAIQYLKSLGYACTGKN